MNPATARTIHFQPGERNVFLHLLTACNLSCRHCYINKEQHGSGSLSRAQITSWLELFADSSRSSNLILLGGEPTLHPHLAEAIVCAKRLGYQVTVDSNGYLFHHLLDRVTPQQLDFLSFSLDGPDVIVNDAIRGDGVFSVCTQNIKKAVAAGFNVSVIYTVSRKNISHLHRMGALLDDLGVGRFFIQVIGLRGNSAVTDSDETSQVSRSEWLATVPQVAADIAARGISVTWPKVFLDEEEIFQCAGNVAENFFIFPNGRVYQCPLCEDHPVHSYEIVDGRLVKCGGLREDAFFPLQIPEGCVMNRLLQPETIEYDSEGKPLCRISCCLLKQQISG